MQRRQKLVQLLVLAGVVLGLAACEQPVDRQDVPTAVLEAFARAYPTVTIKGYSTEKKDGQTVYEIESVEGEKIRDVTYSADGQLISVEETVDVSELPPGVKAALDQKFPGGKILKAEKITKGTVVGYEFKVRHNGRKTEIAFDPQGKESEI